MSNLPPPTGSPVAQAPPLATPPESESLGRSGILVVVLSVAAVISMVVVASTLGNDGSDLGATPTAVVPVPTTTTIATFSPVTDPPVTTAPPITDPFESEVDAVETTLGAPAVDAPTSSAVDDPEPPTYPIAPDGSPVPVVAVYDGAVVTLTGLVPSEEAALRLETLAIAGAPEPNTVAVNLLEINESVPLSVGARVVSLDSVRFPDGSSEILPEHAAELDGVVRTLQALPNVTLLVIGHTDQAGDEFENLVLSRDRADSMVLYLVSEGIDPARLSSRSVGESNPISAENGEAARQLNRRTELIFYGLLIE